MIKKLLLCLMCTTILSSCKKSESAPPVDTEDHVDQTRLNFLKKLEGGSGKWLITKDVTVMYDKNNTVAYVRTNNKPDVYYNFYHLGPIHDFKDLEIAVYPNKVPALLDNSFGFDLTYEGNTFYCTTKYDKMPFENVTENSFDLVTTAVYGASYPTSGSTTGTFADHVKKTMHFVSMP